VLATASRLVPFTRANLFVRHTRCTNQEIDLVRIPRSRAGGARSTTVAQNEDARKAATQVRFLSPSSMAAGRVDQMHAAARKARHGLIALLFQLVRFVGDPALYAQAGLGAAVKKSSHRLIMENGRDRNRAGA